MERVSEESLAIVLVSYPNLNQSILFHAPFLTKVIHQMTRNMLNFIKQLVYAKERLRGYFSSLNVDFTTISNKITLPSNERIIPGSREFSNLWESSELELPSCMRYKALDCVENRKFRIITLIYLFDFSIQFRPSNRSLLNLHLYHNICIHRTRRTKAYELKEKGIGSSRRKMSDWFQCTSA